MLKKNKRITIHTDRKTYNKFQRLADKNYCTISNFMHMFINKQYDKINLNSIPSNAEEINHLESQIQQLSQENSLLKNYSTDVLNKLREIDKNNVHPITQSKLDDIKKIHQILLDDFKHIKSGEGRD